MPRALRILVVDDDRTVLGLFTSLLAREGHDVVAAASGAEGLERVAESRFDVALVDINLPDTSGIEVMRSVVKTTSTIVILITGEVGIISHEDAVREGAADFILKPIRLPELGMRIRQACELRRLAEARERIVADLERLAIRDEMTGLLNLRHFRAQLRLEVGRCHRYARPLSLIIFDADHFKAINDSRGHPTGDQVLIALGRTLERGIRSTDTLFRYGGEEFVALLPETGAELAVGVADRARLLVGDTPLLPDLHVTVSAGVANLRTEDTGEALLCRADKALYQAKRDGRNRVALG